MQNISNATEPGGKASLTARAVGELKRYAVITAYLWLLFALFSLYKRQLLQENGLSVWRQSFAIVNALIFGKVILIAEALELGRSQERRSLAWVALWKSLVFAILLIAFHIAEEVIRAWFEGKALSTGFADFGGGLSGLLTFAAIFFVALIPFFAFHEAARVLGGDALWRLFVHGGKRFRLIEE